MENIETILKKILVNIITAIRPLKRISPRELPYALVKRILIIKQHDQLGDLLVTTPAIRALRNRFPEAHIAIVVREYNAPMIWENPNVNSIILYYEKLKRWKWDMLKVFWYQLRDEGGFDLAIVLNSVSRSVTSDVIALLSKAKYIVGPNHIPLNQGAPEKIYNVITQRNRKIQHESEHYLDIVRHLGAKADGTEYDLQLTAEEEGEADKILYNHEIQSNMLLVGVHFGALNREKRFPLDKLAKVVGWIKSNYNCEIALIVGPNEVNHSQELTGKLRNNEIHTLPLMPLRTACAVIKKMKLLLCNDTATMHIASACRVATISFHSISDPVQWRPPHERHYAIRAADKKMSSISVEMVTLAVQTQMQNMGYKMKEY